MNIVYFLQIVTNHNTSFILEEKIVRVRFINEYSLQWYQFIIVSFIDDFSRLFRFNNVVFYLRNFQEFFSVRMSQHNSSMQKWFRQIADMKFKRRCRFYYEFWRFRVKNDHHCCVKYEDSRHFFVDLSRVRKTFRRFSNFFLLDNVNFMNARINIFRDQHVQKMHSQSREDHSINSMNENKENYSFEKKSYFLCLMIWFFEKTKSFFCSSLRHFVLIFWLSQKC